MYIFDIDGTLLNTISSITYHMNKALDYFNLGQIDQTEVKKNVGNGPYVLVCKCLDYLNVEKGQIRLDVLNYYNKIYDQNPTYLTKAYDGIINQLDIIKSKGEIIAAFSNKPDSTCKKVLPSVIGKDYFDMILGFKENMKRKPSPEGLMIIAERFNEKMSNIIYFGDSEVDIECGKNAGVFTVACTWGFRDKIFLQKHKPDAMIDSPDQITSIRRV